jgi:hypothetical protein
MISALRMISMRRKMRFSFCCKECGFLIRTTLVDVFALMEEYTAFVERGFCVDYLMSFSI